jgi:hypothetical protein
MAGKLDLMPIEVWMPTPLPRCHYVEMKSDATLKGEPIPEANSQVRS